jgi:hypothetical protein
MSSTNRSAAREKHVSDYYVTPLHTIREFLNALQEDHMLPDAPLDILDPCAGGDASNPMAYPNAIMNYSAWPGGRHITTVDIREDSRAETKCDYMRFAPPYGQLYDIAITNPPFNIAMDVIRKALAEVRPGGLVIMLLRLNFFGSRERQAFFQGNMPILTYVHTRRPKFLNTGGTDSIEYMHAVWQVGNPCKFTKLRII